MINERDAFFFSLNTFLTTKAKHKKKNNKKKKTPMMMEMKTRNFRSADSIS